MTTPNNEQQALKEEIDRLKQELELVRNEARPAVEATRQDAVQSLPPASAIGSTSALHTLLLLADSALPLGSFAFSSGLESFLAHSKLKVANGENGKLPLQAQFNSFLSLSLQSLALTALPYVLAAYRDPVRLEELDNDFDASTPCVVARRASVAQGRALVSVWERSFKVHASVREEGNVDGKGMKQAKESFAAFSAAMRNASSAKDAFPLNAHLPPLWGIVTLLLGLDLRSSAYLFLFSHARTVISAAVRASVLGPYQAQAVLAAMELQAQIEGLVAKYWDRQTEDAGQAVPVMDIWIGRHEKLYSRIFNS